MLQEAIKRLILERGLKPGDPLPPEAELMRDLGVSRTALREAIKALQAVGIVNVRHGFGTFVGDVSLTGFAQGLVFRSRLTLDDGLEDLRELIEVREALETGLMPRVVAAATPQNVADLDRVVSAMEEHAKRGETAENEDRRFHELLYDPLGKNRLLIQLIGAFWNAFNEVGPLLGGEIDLPATASEHRRIVSAIAASDAHAAVSAMTDHFQGIRSRVETAAASRQRPRSA